MDTSSLSFSSSQDEPWSLLQEGQLLVDVYERPDALVIRSLVAGIRPENLEIALQDDLLTIRGKREETELVCDNQFFHKECYWGSFSRSIILPVNVHADKIKALFKNGILMIVLPKKTIAQTIVPKTESDFLS